MTIQEQYENLVKTVRGYNPAADFQHIEAAYEFADSSPYPDPSEAFTDVYCEDNERCVAR